MRTYSWMLAVIALVACFAIGCEDAVNTASPTPAPTQGMPATAAATIVTRPTTINEVACSPPYPAPPYDAVTVFCADPSPMERATVLDIVDGDTFDVLLAGVEERVRIFGIDTAERGEPCFREASERLRALAGGEVRLVPDVRKRDRNGRLLRYVYTPDGRSVDATLIEEGLAHAWTDDGALRDPLVVLEDQARLAGRGCLWR